MPARRPTGPTPPRRSGPARRATPKRDDAATPAEPGSKRPRGAFGVMPAAGAEPAGGESTPPPPWVEWTMRIGGTVVGLALGFVTAIYEVYLIPLRLSSAGHARVPLAVLVAIVANAGLVWFTRVVTGRVGPALLPGIPWLLVMLVAGNETADGDLLITGNNWVGIATILCGAVAWAVAGYMMILRAKRGPLPPKE